MFSALKDPQVINVLQEIKPFLGPTGRSVSEMVEALGEILSSESNQKAVKALTNLLGVQDEFSMQGTRLTSFVILTPYFYLTILPLLLAQASNQNWQ